MGLDYTHQSRVDSRDVDGLGRCKASALLGHLQEAATRAAEAGGFGRGAFLTGHGAFWMLTRMWYRLERPLHWDEVISIRTWHRGGKSALMYRDFDLYCGAEQVGEAVSAWVLASLEDRRLLRLSTIGELDGTDGGSLCKSRTLNRLHLPEGMAEAECRLMHYSDTDLNGHVNNTRYADFACDALHQEGIGAGRFLQELQLNYQAECRAGERLRLLTGRGEGRAFVQGVDKAGKSRFEGTLIFSEVVP